VSGWCRKHEQHRYNYGSPTARVITKAEVKPYTKIVERALKLNARHEAVLDVMQSLNELLQKAVDEASRIRSMPRPSDHYGKMYLELNRLAASGLTAMQLFTVVAATTLYCNWSNIDSEVLYVTIARHVFVSRRLGVHRHDPRMGRRPVQCGLQTRLLLGRTLHGIVFPVLEALSAVMSKASEIKTERGKRIAEALANEPLKVPGETRIRTKSGTVITSYAAPAKPT
jgi:hypothetical protein